MLKLLQAPFWLDAGDPHRMRSAMQLLTRPRATPLDLRHRNIAQEGGLAVVTEGISPEQAVDEAIQKATRGAFALQWLRSTQSVLPPA
jgi:hypothetical protein